MTTPQNEEMTPEKALDLFYQCIVDAVRSANERFGFGAVAFRRKHGAGEIMGVRYPDGTEERLYEVGAQWSH